MTDPQLPQQPWAGQPAYPPVPPKKRRVWPWVLGGFFACLVLLFGGCAALLGGAVHEAAKQDQARTQAAPAGSEVRDGKFAFVVTGVDQPVPTIGDNPYLKRDAQGEFVQVHVDVSNTGDQAQTYFGSNQKLVDAQGRTYDNDMEAEMNVNQDLSAQINPGNKLSVTIVFDVPVGTTTAAIEFHDSLLSGGARVAVG